MTMETISELDSLCDAVFSSSGVGGGGGVSDAPLSTQHWTRRAFRGRRSVRVKSDGDSTTSRHRVSRASSVRVSKSSQSILTRPEQQRPAFLDDFDINRYKNGKCLRASSVSCDVI